MSNLIRHDAIAEDLWTIVKLPAPAEETVRKQAGKVVLFKLTGEAGVTPRADHGHADSRQRQYHRAVVGMARAQSRIGAAPRSWRTRRMASHA